jgi:hypothetical protein
MRKLLGIIESEITMTHAYLGTAGGMSVYDILTGHYPYGLLVMALAVIEELKNDS